MPISFNHIPNNLRTPLFYVEIDNSMANSALETQRTLLIGQMLDGTTEPDIPVKVSSEKVVAGLCGQGSMLHTMTKKYLANDEIGEIWILPLKDDDTEMQQAKGSITFGGALANSGVISLYIAAERIQLSVGTDDTLEEIVADLANKINANKDLPVIATANTTDKKIEFTSKNYGVSGNGIDIRFNYYGSAGGEYTPTGLIFTIEKMTGGAGTPKLAQGLANLQDRAFDFIINPYTDTSSLDLMKEFLSDNTGRWAWDKQIYGHSYSVISGTYGEASTLGESRNNQHETIWAVYDSPNTTYDLVSAFVGAIAGAIRNDPGRPTQTLKISSILPPPLENRFNLQERNNLLYSGISTFTVADDGTAMIENTITTYQYNNYGSADNSYLQIETLYLLAYINRFMRTQITSKFARMKLAADGTRFGAGQAIVTPGIIKSELIAQYKTLEYNGFVQNAKAFAQQVIVEQDSSNPNRVNVLWTGTLINQLRIFAVLNQFRLKSDQ